MTGFLFITDFAKCGLLQNNILRFVFKMNFVYLLLVISYLQANQYEN